MTLDDLAEKQEFSRLAARSLRRNVKRNLYAIAIQGATTVGTAAWAVSAKYSQPYPEQTWEYYTMTLCAAVAGVCTIGMLIATYNHIHKFTASPTVYARENK